jgi:hypothetical protein
MGVDGRYLCSAALSLRYILYRYVVGAPGEEFSCVLSWMRNEKGVDSEA